MKLKSISQRFLINTFSVTCAILLLGGIVFNFGMNAYYDNFARQLLTKQSDIAANTLLHAAETSIETYCAEVKQIVETAVTDNSMRISAIDHNGNIAISSSGFAEGGQYTLPDYATAMESPAGNAFYKGKNSNGEEVMAYTIALTTINPKYSAVRFETSLENINQTLVWLNLTYGLAATVMLILLAVMGNYFVRSIVLPIRKISVAAQNFAMGDMTKRIEKKSDDELGRLIETINTMADEMSAAETAKNEFISSVSHELRTPLTAIKGWSETLADIPDDAAYGETRQKGMRIIADETERLSMMVEELLDFSRMQNGKLSLQKSKIDVLAEIGEAVLIYKQQAEAGGVILQYSEPDMLMPVWGDKNRLRQVFINIIDNAVKYCDSGGAVTVLANISDEYAVIVVSDTGCGIPKDALPHIKEKFYKANNKKHGSGIGLAVANEIIQMHSGELEVESTENVGTTVTVRLPLYKEENAEGESDEQQQI